MLFSYLHEILVHDLNGANEHGDAHERKNREYQHQGDLHYNRLLAGLILQCRNLPAEINHQSRENKRHKIAEEIQRGFQLGSELDSRVDFDH